MAPVGRRFSSVDDLLTNTREVFLDCTEVLLKFADNILGNPDDEKFRKIRIGNKHVQARVLPVDGGMQCLFEMGFEEDTDGEFLNLPKSTSLDKLKAVREELMTERQKLTEKVNAASSQRQEPIGAAAAPSATPQASGVQSSVTGASAGATLPGGQMLGQQAQNLVGKMTTELSFFTKMRTSFAHVTLYENPAMQFMAKRCVPQGELRDNALQKERQMLSSLKDGDDRSKLPDYNDFLLLELLDWFKNKFFKWVDAPECSVCGGSTEPRGSAEPTPDDLTYGANRVENYWCGKCSRYERFPRYNHPGKLLETRRGRCGEWANCFCLLCRTLGFETRYVLDWTDHVWAEVYSHAQQRWLHCDPCENVCDKPLTYEVGWGKKLSYVLAFAKDDIQDVTMRYTRNINEVLLRRTECRENWLVQQIMKLRNERQKQLPEGRKKELTVRTINELSELFQSKDANQDELQGRQSGSVGWRLARGEMGSNAGSCKTGYTFTLTEKERQRKVFHLRYCCANDSYERVVDRRDMKSWDCCLFEMENVFRKDEHDWKMVYLARKEGTPTASIKWQFDFRDSGLVVDQITIKASSQMFESGSIRWTLCSSSSCVMLNGSSILNTQDLSGSDVVTLSAEMSGGNGDIAWQHTQLFRQKNDETASFPLEIRVTLK